MSDRQAPQSATDSFSSGWQPLRCLRKSGSQSTCPKLFYDFQATPWPAPSISVTLTDLIGMWSCSLDATQIVNYARSNKTSIDPSQSRSQYNILFRKLALSLKSGTNILCRREDQTLTDTIGDETLVLSTRLELPSPLQPLVWRFELQVQSGAAISQRILRPCLHEAVLLHSKLESLLDVVKTKDHVISKLVEKIELANLDFGLIFPGITGTRTRKGQTTLRDASRHVAGLSAFEVKRWESLFDTEDENVDFQLKGFSNLVAGLRNCPSHDTDQHEKWLEELDVFDNNDCPASVNRAETAQRQDDSDSDSARTASATDSEGDLQERGLSVITESNRINRKQSENSDDDFESDTRSLERSRTERPSVQAHSKSPSLPPLRPEISRDLTSSSDSSSNLSITRKPLSTPNLGKLGAKPVDSRFKPSMKCQATISSSPLPAPELSSSSPPLVPNDSQTAAPPSTGRHRPPNRANGRLGSSDVASSPSTNTASASDLPNTPQRRLGKLKSTIPSSPLKLQLLRSDQAETETSPPRRNLTRQDSTQTSEPPTPSRRLGRLKKIQSQDRNQDNRSQLQAQKSSQTAFNRLDSLPGTKRTGAPIDPDETVLEGLHNNSTSSSSPSPTTNSSAKVKIESLERRTVHQASPPPPRVLTEEEKTAQRREELKRKTAPAQNSSRGARKKRKF